MSRAKDLSMSIGNFEFGVRIYPYKLAFGISFQYWPCIITPHMSIHFLIFHFWISFFAGKKEKKNGYSNLYE